MIMASTHEADAMAGQARAGTAGFLYSYRVDSPASFDPAYAAHLEWHRRHDDHLAWYGWYVIAGARTGMFVDGTFGSRLEAVDRRPDPAGDGRDFATGAALHSQPVGNSAWLLWPEVSTSFTLEDRQPTPMVEVLQLAVEPARAAEFEALLSRLAAAHGSRPGTGWTWYRLLAGGAHPSYLVMIPLLHWADFEDRPRSLAAFAAQAYGRDLRQAGALDGMIRNHESEIWRYRADLSYFPATR